MISSAVYHTSASNSGRHKNFNALYLTSLALTILESTAFFFFVRCRVLPLLGPFHRRPCFCNNRLLRLAFCDPCRWWGRGGQDDIDIERGKLQKVCFDMCIHEKLECTRAKRKRSVAKKHTDQLLSAPQVHWQPSLKACSLSFGREFLWNNRGRRSLLLPTCCGCFAPPPLLQISRFLIAFMTLARTINNCINTTKAFRIFVHTVRIKSGPLKRRGGDEYTDELNTHK